MRLPLLIALLLFSLPSVGFSNEKLRVYTKGLIVDHLEGLVRIQDENKKDSVAQKGKRLLPGTTVMTGPASEIILKSDEGDQYHIEENSTIIISKPIKDKLFSIFSKKKKNEPDTSKKSTMEMLRGKINVHVKPNKEKEVKISSPVSTLSVKGTTFSVEFDGKTMTLSVYEGIVEMENFGGSKVEVIGGMMSDTQTWRTRKLDKNLQNNLKIDILDKIEVPQEGKKKQGFLDEKFPSFKAKDMNFNRKQNATFNWSTYDLDIEIQHPARNPSHQRNSVISDLPPAPPTR